MFLVVLQFVWEAKTIISQNIYSDKTTKIIEIKEAFYHNYHFGFLILQTNLEDMFCSVKTCIILFAFGIITHPDPTSFPGKKAFYSRDIFPWEQGWWNIKLWNFWEAAPTWAHVTKLPMCQFQDESTFFFIFLFYMWCLATKMEILL